MTKHYHVEEFLGEPFVLPPVLSDTPERQSGAVARMREYANYWQQHARRGDLPIRVTGDALRGYNVIETTADKVVRTIRSRICEGGCRTIPASQAKVRAEVTA